MVDRTVIIAGSASPDARILLALLVDIDELYNAARSWYSSLTLWSGMTRKYAESLASATNRSVDGESAAVAKPSEDELHQAMLNGIRDKV